VPDSLDQLVDRLKAAAEPSRLRLLAICSRGEWTVSELVRILGQSQPRVSRHLRILAEAGLLERLPEGSLAFYRRVREGPGVLLARRLLELLPPGDPMVEADRRRMEAVREERRRRVERWFDTRALAWDSERDLGVDGRRVERALLERLGGVRPRRLLDVGTGTGRILELLAPLVGEGIGIDISHRMLEVARVRLDRAGFRHCRVQQADMYALPFPDGHFDLVTFHQVLHFADDPEAALGETVRVLAPGGRLVVVDLARHDREELRRERRHRRLGFEDAEMRSWFATLGLEPEEPVRLAGEELTVVIWTGRKPAPRGLRVAA